MVTVRRAIHAVMDERVLRANASRHPSAMPARRLAGYSAKGYYHSAERRRSSCSWRASVDRPAPAACGSCLKQPGLSRSCDVPG
jgi:hypothetical protein